MRIVSVASGNSGNRIYMGSDDTHILVDTGISNERIQQGLSEIGLNEDDVNRILITHGHPDHTKGLEVLPRKYHMPVYGTGEALGEIASSGSLGELDKGLLTPICPDVDFTLGGLNMRPFEIDHDAANPVAYRVDYGGRLVMITTDMEHSDQYIIDSLRGLDALLLESDHDVHMLETGPYPYYLKRKILGDRSHLSNESAGRLLDCVLHGKLKRVFLGHLSKENNYEELAYETVRLEIDEGDYPCGVSDLSISVADRDHMSGIVYL